MTVSTKLVNITDTCFIKKTKDPIKVKISLESHN